MREPDHLVELFEGERALLGAALQHFRMGEVRQPGQAGVALYTPDFDRHGWHSPHTVIDVVTDDMPFLVDSITMVVYRHGLVIHRLVHPLLGAERGGDGKLQRALPRGAAGSRPESWIHIEIDRVGDGQLIDGLRHEVAAVLGDVRAAVDDGATMQQRMHEAHAELMTAPVAESDEAAAYAEGMERAEDALAEAGADGAAGEEVEVEPEGGETITAGRAETWRHDYAARVDLHRSEIRAQADRCGLSFIVHRTDRPASELLLQLHARLSAAFASGSSRSVLARSA